MIKNKISKKDLRNLLSETIGKAVQALDLPKPNKKVKKVIDNQSRKLASEFASILKEERKKQKKADKKMGKALSNVEKKVRDKSRENKQKDRKNQNGKLVEPIAI